MQKRVISKAVLQFYLNYTDTPTHRHPKVPSTHEEQPPPEEYLWKTVSVRQKSFKKLKL